MCNTLACLVVLSVVSYCPGNLNEFRKEAKLHGGFTAKADSKLGYRTPTIASDWFRIVEYSDRHLNDFCLFLDQRGTWHAIGICGTGTWASEQAFFHSTGATLNKRFTNHATLFEGMPQWIGKPQSKNNAPQKHAPFVVHHEGIYHMFYRRPKGTNLHVKTDNPMQWPNRVQFAFEKQDARDSCVIHNDEIFYHYSCQAMQIDGIWRSCVAVRESADLHTWSPAKPAHVDTNKVHHHSYTESPFVVARPEGYYLFVRHRLFNDPVLTTVYFSRDPRRFPSGKKAWFAELKDIHAPEIVEYEKRYYIARVSGKRRANPQAPDTGGWIEVAELQFQ